MENEWTKLKRKTTVEVGENFGKCIDLGGEMVPMQINLS